MFGTLREIEITEELIMEVAIEEYKEEYGGDLLEESDWVIGMHHDSVVTWLEEFNTAVRVFRKIGFKCNVDNFGRGHDVDEFYKE